MSKAMPKAVMGQRHGLRHWRAGVVMTLLVACSEGGGPDGRGPDASPGPADGPDAPSPLPDAGHGADAGSPSPEVGSASGYLYAGAGSAVFKMKADLVAGTLQPAGRIPAGDDVRLVEVAPDGRHVYVQTEIGTAQAVLFFDIGPAGALTQGGELRLPYPLVQGVTQISRHPQEAWFVLSATNESPGLEDQLMPVETDGRLGPHRSISQLFYAFAWDPAGRFFYGLDGEEIFQNGFDAVAGTITPIDPPRAEGSAGRTVLGLRNHPGGRWIYSVEEGAIGLFTLDAERGPLTAQDFWDNPVPDESIYWTALGLHPTGGFLYALGYLSPSKVALVDVFAIDGGSGRLTFVERQKAEGSRALLNQGLQAPLVLDRLLVLGGESTAQGSQGAPVLALYQIDGTTGRLTPAGPVFPLPEGDPGGVSFVFAIQPAP